MPSAPSEGAAEIRDEGQATTPATDTSLSAHHPHHRHVPDPELDATVTEHSIPYEPQPEAYLRLVANPFLGVFALIIWLGLMTVILRGAAGAFTTLAVLLALASLSLLPKLLHYHCLDCGGTGPLTTWRRHICPNVIARRFEGRTRRIRGPSPTVQILLWLWLLATLLVTWQANIFTRR